MMHVRQRIGVLIARANTEFILAGVMNSGNDIDPIAEREAQLQRREVLGGLQQPSAPTPGGDSPGPQLRSQQYLSSRAAGSGDGRPLLEVGCPAPANPWVPREAATARDTEITNRRSIRL